MQLLEHIERFLGELPAMIEAIDTATFSSQRQSLAEQFDPAALPLAEAAELLWQGKQAGHSSDYLAQLPLAIQALQHSDLIAAARRLNDAEGGWRCLATRSEPPAPWQVAQGSLPLVQ
ncbi:hypothetical protein D3C73_850390 [compost metagenome]